MFENLINTLLSVLTKFLQRYQKPIQVKHLEPDFDKILEISWM